jgi:galactose mutarotase-like enzyme
MIVNLENALLKVAIKSKGAELNSVSRKDNGLGYMWSGDPAVWGKTSPVLFPIVGTLKDNTYFYNGKPYTLSRHGFARDAEFEILEQEQQKASFILKDSETSFANYPFHFELILTYELDNDLLKTSYEVRNTGTDNMYFSLGAHPAFKVPIVEGKVYEDYYLQFDHVENAGRWSISKEGLIQKNPISFLNNSSRINLTRTLFQEDALVFKHLQSQKVSLVTNLNSHGLDFYFEGFPYLGLWAAKGGDFVCIEPWCGIADSVDHDQQLINKEGIEILAAGNMWIKNWDVRFF